MPKKTKQQKRLADKRRSRFTPAAPVFREVEVVESEKKPAAVEMKQPAVPSKTKHYELTEEERRLYQITIADLRKTAIITSVLFALEFLVFYANLKGII